MYRKSLTLVTRIYKFFSLARNFFLVIFLGTRTLYLLNVMKIVGAISEIQFIYTDKNCLFKGIKIYIMFA